MQDLEAQLQQYARANDELLEQVEQLQHEASVNKQGSRRDIEFEAQIRTKEEEIQMLWKMLRQVNSEHHSPLALGRLEKLISGSNSAQGKENAHFN